MFSKIGVLNAFSTSNTFSYWELNQGASVIGIGEGIEKSLRKIILRKLPRTKEHESLNLKDSTIIISNNWKTRTPTQPQDTLHNFRAHKDKLL